MQCQAAVKQPVPADTRSRVTISAYPTPLLFFRISPKFAPYYAVPQPYMHTRQGDTPSLALKGPGEHMARFLDVGHIVLPLEPRRNGILQNPQRQVLE